MYMYRAFTGLFSSYTYLKFTQKKYSECLENDVNLVPWVCTERKTVKTRAPRDCRKRLLPAVVAIVAERIC